MASSATAQLAPARYTLSVVATDNAGNKQRRATTKRFRVR